MATEIKTSEPSVAKATLRYLDWLPEYDTIKPYVLRRKVPASMPKSNVKTSSVDDILIQDVRGHESEFSLDVHGFSFRPWTGLSPSDTEISIEKYLEEVKELLSTSFKAPDVRIFDFKARIPLTNSLRDYSDTNASLPHNSFAEVHQ